MRVMGFVAGWVVVVCVAACGDEPSMGERRPSILRLGAKEDRSDGLRWMEARLSCTESVSGHFEPGSDAHVYTLEARAGVTVNLSYVADYAPWYGSTIGVYDASGARVAHGGTLFGERAALGFAPTKDGVYQVAVYPSWRAARGSYTLTARCETVACTGDRECPSGQFCGKPDGCGFTQGVCTPLGQECNDRDAPVCACNGLTYKNRCRSRAVALSVAYEGGCVALATNKAIYDRPDLITATLSNPTSETLYLDGCGFGWHEDTRAGWVDRGYTATCPSPRAVYALPAGKTAHSAVFPKTGGVLRLATAYGFGCTPGKSLLEAGCRAVFNTVSASFSVRMEGCNYAPTAERSYQGQSRAACDKLVVKCSAGFQPFDDSCGCGCVATR
ncbi:MAG: hypothetical protein IT371_04700 [Deltaproteobacteria bacterium]|nr:hypothetical protein [Deltaproteobacteria bacterium]